MTGGLGEKTGPLLFPWGLALGSNDKNHKHALTPAGTIAKSLQRGGGGGGTTTFSFCVASQEFAVWVNPVLRRGKFFWGGSDS